MSDLDDPLLARARMLLDAAKQTTEILKPTINIDVSNVKTKTSKSHKEPKSEDRLNKVFGATVFKGSTLINTHEDIRQFVGRGDQIVIDGICCSIAQNGEWTATCIEITTDFPGDNNFNASLSIATANNILNSPKRKKPMIPVATESIKAAVEQLTNFKEVYVSKIESSEVFDKKNSSTNLKPVKKTKPKKVFSDLPYQSSFLSSNGGSGGLGYADSYNFQPPPTNIVSSSSAFPSNSLYNEYYSPNNNNSNNNNYNNSSGISNNTNKYSTSTKTNHPIEYPLSNAERDNVVNKQIIDFNEQRKQQIDPVKLALERVKQKQLEEAKMKELLDQEKEKKRIAEITASELKVNELKAKTQERVARYKESLLKKAEEEKLKKEMELFEKREREKQVSSEAYKEKLIENRKQSQRRLRQIALEDQRREQEKHMQIQAKLDSISKKYDVLSTYATPAVMAQRVKQANSSEDGGSQSGSRPNSRVKQRKPSKQNNNSSNGGVMDRQPSNDNRKNNDNEPWDPYAEIEPAYAGLYNNNPAAVMKELNSVNQKPIPNTKFQPIPKGEDEWSEDEEDDMDNDSIEMSKHSNSYYGTNNVNNYNNKNNNNNNYYTKGEQSYHSYSKDDDNLSDVSGDGNTQLRGADHIAYTQKSSSAKGNTKPTGSATKLPPYRPSSQPLTPSQTKTNLSKIPVPSQGSGKLPPLIKNQSISNSSSASSIHANQLYQQQVHQQSLKAVNNPNYKVPIHVPQQQVQQPPALPLQYSYASPPEKKNSPKKPSVGVWRKLQPIPIAPYKEVHSVDPGSLQR